MKLKNPADMLKLLVVANESGLNLTDDMIRKLTEDREAFDSLLSVAAETLETRGAILRAIVTRASVAPSPPAVTGKASAGKRPTEGDPAEVAVIEYMRKVGSAQVGAATIATACSLDRPEVDRVIKSLVAQWRLAGKGHGRGRAYTYVKG